MMPVAMRHGNLPQRHHACLIAYRMRSPDVLMTPVTEGKVILLRFKQSFEVNPWDDCFVV